jgi:hypothetical protein
LVVGSTLIFTATEFLNLHATLVNDADLVPDTDPIFHFDPTPSYSQVINILFNYYSQHCQFTWFCGGAPSVPTVFPASTVT